MLKVLNLDVQELAVEDDLFNSAAPYLFGDGLEQKMKDQAEAMKLLSKVKCPPLNKKYVDSKQLACTISQSAHSVAGRLKDFLPNWVQVT